jgi:hypothetical protein
MIRFLIFLFLEMNVLDVCHNWYGSTYVQAGHEWIFYCIIFTQKKHKLYPGKIPPPLFPSMAKYQ